jgi:hypothetical protein
MVSALASRINLQQRVDFPSTEEQLAGVLLPTHNVPYQSTRSVNNVLPRRHTDSTSHRNRTRTLRDVISAHVEEIVQSAFGLDDGEDSSNVSPPSFDYVASGLSIAAAVSSMNPSVGIDIEFGDVGIRHRSADSTTQNDMRD